MGTNYFVNISIVMTLLAVLCKAAGMF